MFEWLVLYFFIEFGVVPNNGWIMYETEHHTAAEAHYYIDLGVRAQLYEYFFIEGAVKTRMWDEKNEWTFAPFNSEYRFGFGVQAGPLTMGFRHLCTHPVIPYINSVPPGPIQYEGGYDEIYFRIDYSYGENKARRMP